MRHQYLLFIALLVGVIITSGCISGNQNTVVTPTPQIIYVTVLVTPTQTIIIPTTNTPATSLPSHAITPTLVENTPLQGESSSDGRTDFKIIATFADSKGTAQIWMKNIGVVPISSPQIQKASVFFGGAGSFNHLAHTSGSLGNDQWIEDFSPDYDLNKNKFWDPGETLKVTTKTTAYPQGSKVIFQFALTNSVWRSIEFTVN